MVTYNKTYCKKVIQVGSGKGFSLPSESIKEDNTCDLSMEKGPFKTEERALTKQPRQTREAGHPTRMEA